MHNISNPEADGLQKQGTTPDATLINYERERNIKIGLCKIGQILPGLMNLNFCCDIQMLGSEFGVNNMKGYIYPVFFSKMYA